MSEVTTTTQTTQNPTTIVTPPASTTTSVPSWTASLDADTQAYVTTKGFKEPKDVLESYRNFEKLQGVPRERLVALPESLEGEAMNPVWERLGAVKDPKEYKIDIPKEFADDKFTDFLRDSFHKLKVPRQMAEGFAKSFVERQTASLAERKANYEASVTAEQTALKKEWGVAYEQNEAIANNASTRFGMTKEHLQALGNAMGPANALKFLHKLGEGLGESKFINGNGSKPGVLTPDQARQEIKSLIDDTDFRRRLSAKDSDALAKWNRLHEQASPGQLSI